MDIKMLHVVREGGGLGYPCGLMRLKGLLGAVEGVKEHVLLLGSQLLAEECESVGIEGAERLGVPGSSGVAGYFGIRRRVRELGDIQIVSCDDVGLLWAANRAAKNARKLLWLNELPVGRRLLWLRKFMNGRRGDHCRVVVSGEVMRNELARLGIPAGRVKIVGPAADEGEIVRDEAVLGQKRVKWGAVGEDKFVVGLLSDRPYTSDTRLVSLAGGTSSLVVSHKLGRPWQMRVLVNAMHMHRDRSVDLNDEFGHLGLLVQEGGTSRGWEILEACDAVVVTGKGSGESLAWACMSGKPMLVEGNARLRGMLSEVDGAEEMIFDEDDLRKPSDVLTVWAMDEKAKREAGELSKRVGEKLFGRMEQRAVYEGIVRGLVG
ncbi:hypothetical protein [Poriferisphaera corsica]|uniref:hypothetical protein n=1 Tax=Poriferisphaera corsica TaxID=2528020 RepID=UPI0011A8DD13|nr:hypothetical protein [Poriferisphaera corsica]